MPSDESDEDLLAVAALKLSLEVSPPDDSTAVLTCSFKEGPAYAKQRHTFVWVRQEDQWQCVMHSRSPEPSTH
jgi:hypothetical protein